MVLLQYLYLHVRGLDHLRGYPLQPVPPPISSRQPQAEGLPRHRIYPPHQLLAGGRGGRGRVEWHHQKAFSSAAHQSYMADRNLVIWGQAYYGKYQKGRHTWGAEQLVKTAENKNKMNQLKKATKRTADCNVMASRIDLEMRAIKY